MSIKDKIENAREDDWLTKDLSEEELNKIKEAVNRKKEKIMTIEEAIKILSVEKELHTLQLTTSNDNHYEKIQALDMAISALKKESKEESDIHNVTVTFEKEFRWKKARKKNDLQRIIRQGIVGFRT